jgi:hypothetical protein
MKTVRDLVLALTTGVLLVASIVHMYFVVPVYRGLFDALGVTLSGPARLAVAVSHFGVLFFLGGGALVVFGLWKQRRGADGALALTLAVVALIAAAYLVLVTAVYLDYARIVDRIR